MMLDGMIKTDLKIISTGNGSVMHGIKKQDNGFMGFGEMYNSTVEYGAIKAWKLHRRMTLNLIVPIGKVLFCFFDLRKGSKTFNRSYKIILSQNPYFRLTVPSEIWFGFKGLHEELNMITNVANISHDPKELMRKELHEIEMDWSVV